MTYLVKLTNALGHGSVYYGASGSTSASLSTPVVFSRRGDAERLAKRLRGAADGEFVVIGVGGTRWCPVEVAL